jgi:hypothetical protein
LPTRRKDRGNALVSTYGLVRADKPAQSFSKRGTFTKKLGGTERQLSGKKAEPKFTVLAKQQQSTAVSSLTTWAKLIDLVMLKTTTQSPNFSSKSLAVLVFVANSKFFGMIEHCPNTNRGRCYAFEDCEACWKDARQQQKWIREVKNMAQRGKNLDRDRDKAGVLLPPNMNVPCGSCARCGCEDPPTEEEFISFDRLEREVLELEATLESDIIKLEVMTNELKHLQSRLHNVRQGNRRPTKGA